MSRKAEALRAIDEAGVSAPVGTSPSDEQVLLERVQRDFEEFGLNGYQARILVQLLRLGSASPAQLARAAGVHRTSAYPVLQELLARGVAELVPGQTSLWTTPGRDEVVDRLWSAHEERLQNLRGRVDATREILAQIAPEQAAGGVVPYVHLLSNAAQARGIYDRLLAEAKTEFVVLNRPPYSPAGERSKSERAATEALNRDEVNPEVLSAIKRGVSIRVLYERAAWEDPSAASFRAAMGEYHAAGVDGRLVDELPIKLAMSDRRSALIALTDEMLPDIGFPTNLVIEHAGFCEYQADAFEHRWQMATPCPATRQIGRFRRVSQG